VSVHEVGTGQVGAACDRFSHLQQDLMLPFAMPGGQGGLLRDFYLLDSDLSEKKVCLQKRFCNEFYLWLILIS
jgi:hypothetical protein